MTNYNDGNWHGWNGGECPVHPETRLQGVEPTAVGWAADAKDVDWQSFRGAFRVVKEHREPREMWVCIYDASAWDSKDQAEKHDEERGPIIHVREVIE